MSSGGTKEVDESTSAATSSESSQIPAPTLSNEGEKRNTRNTKKGAVSLNSNCKDKEKESSGNTNSSSSAPRLNLSGSTWGERSDFGSLEQLDGMLDKQNALFAEQVRDLQVKMGKYQVMM